MDGVGFLNLQYILLAFYNAVTGHGVSSLSFTVRSITDLIMGFGIFASLVLLAMLVYAHMRLEQVQLEAKHHRYDAIAQYEGKRVVKNERWDHVQQLMTSASPSDWRSAIIESDILLGELLSHFSVPGGTIGEQLKNVTRTSFTTLDLAWEAHRVRNEVAHAGSTYQLTEREARRTVDLFRQVFDEFGII